MSGVDDVRGDFVLAGALRVDLAAGTAAATPVALAAMAVGDALVSVLSFTTAAAIATVADRTVEYVVGAGQLDKAAGTNEAGNQLLIIWLELV
jgi:nitrous oxide reductase